jgi:hypothetical protein
LSTITDVSDTYAALAFSASFDYTSAAARGARTASFAAWAGGLGRGLSKASVRQDFPFAVTQPTVTLPTGATIRAGISGHTARSVSLVDSVPVSLRGQVEVRSRVVMRAR